MKRVLFYLGLLVSFVHALPAQTYTIELQPGAAAGKDALIFERSDTYNQNSGTTSSLQVSEWTGRGMRSQQHQLLGFDLSELPANVRVKSAELSLFFNPDGKDGRGFGHYGDVPTDLLVQSVTEPWEENEVNWNNRPAHTTKGQVQLAGHVRPDQDYEGIDVSSIVVDMLDGKSHGFYLQLARNQRYQMLQFASSDHKNKALHPKLVITFTADGYDGVPNVGLPEVYPSANDGRFLLDLTDVARGQLFYQVFDDQGGKVSEPVEVKGRDLVPVRIAEPDRGGYFITFLLDGKILTTRSFNIR
jgi:hypothetical protein